MIRRSTWITLLVFVVLLVSTILWQKYKPAKEAEATPTTEAGTLLDIEPSKIVRFEVKNLAGKVVAAQVDASGIWTLEGYTAAETDSNQVQTILQQLTNLKVLALLEQSPASDLVGLNEPAYIIKVDMQDGSEKVAYIGSQTPTSSGYYARLEGGKIVVVSKFHVESVIGILDTPPLLPTSTPTESATLTPELTSSPTPTP